LPRIPYDTDDERCLNLSDYANWLRDLSEWLLDEIHRLAELMIEASDAAIRTRIRRDEVYQMFEPVIAKLMANPAPEQGKLITECYDLQRHEPSPEYRELIARVKSEFEDCGLQWQ